MAEKDPETVKVVVRCRPLNSTEERDGRTQIVHMDSRLGTVSVATKLDEPPKTFTFDAVFPPHSLQEAIYTSTAKPILDSVMQGYNGTIFACARTARIPWAPAARRGSAPLAPTPPASRPVPRPAPALTRTARAGRYGQTGTGKTFTMEGVPDPPELKGIIPRAFHEIFEQILSQGGESLEFLVRASYLEIYNEEIRDLLSKNPHNKLELKESPDSGVYVRDLTSYVVKTVSSAGGVRGGQSGV